MKFIVILLSAIIIGVSCSDNTTIADLPPGVAAQLISLLRNKTIDVIGDCGDIKESDIELSLYTRNSSNSPTAINLTNPAEIDSSNKFIFLIHGWISNPTTFVPEMTDAYLGRYNANVITVDWSKLAKSFYPTAVCYVPKVAELVANFLCLLDERFQVSPKEVHLVGHSLGGQMSGLIGQHVKSKCGKALGRITAMDPAGPLYQGLPVEERVDRSDAVFVDVIHTNAAVLGYWGNIGDADFYVNCGTIQLGCPEIALSLAAIKNIPVSLVTCHHSRSVDYMTESVANAGTFKATSCSSCPLPCLFNLLKSSAPGIVMGEDCPQVADGGFVLSTNLYSPFGGPKTVIPGSPDLPTLPTLPDLPSLPTVPALPSVPRLFI